MRINRDSVNKEAQAIIRILKELERNDQKSTLMSHPAVILPLFTRLHDLALFDVTTSHIREESMGNETASELEKGYNI